MYYVFQKEWFGLNIPNTSLTSMVIRLARGSLEGQGWLEREETQQSIHIHRHRSSPVGGERKCVSVSVCGSLHVSACMFVCACMCMSVSVCISCWCPRSYSCLWLLGLGSISKVTVCSFFQNLNIFVSHYKNRHGLFSSRHEPAASFQLPQGWGGGPRLWRYSGKAEMKNGSWGHQMHPESRQAVLF